jgi:MoaA/NifB/PqqE/SkfB family radical SAM enzyme
MMNQKILLALLPYWTPLIPPQGIASLKVFLEAHGFRVKTVDVNVENPFKKIYQGYFQTLQTYIPRSHWGNFYNIGHDVLRNHMMACFNQSEEPAYLELVKLLIYNTFFREFNDRQVRELNDHIEHFYRELSRYFLRLLETEKPAVVGLTAHLGTLAACMFCHKLTKAHCPDILTVLGGTIFAGELPIDSPDFQLLMEKTPYIDKVIVGEGEVLLLRLLQGELPESRRVFTAADIQYQSVDIGSKALPDFSDFDLPHYPYMAAYASRSCPHQCRFCNVAAFFGEYRHKSVRQTVADLIELQQRYGYQLYFMTDSLLNPIMDELAGELIARGLSIYMDTYMRVSKKVADIDRTILWRRAGLYRVRMGIETGSPRMLDLMGKNITVGQSRAALAALAAAGIKTTAYFVIGFPGETEADFQETLDFVAEMKSDIWEVECNPFYYYYTGQPNADQWAAKRRLLYPESARQLLISQTWVLDCEPRRPERFRRLFRFTEHCRQLGIPNPYSSMEIYQADERWKSLHANAVPSMIEFEDNTAYIDENKAVKRLLLARDTGRDEGDFLL